MAMLILEQQWYTGEGEKNKIDLISTIADIISVSPIDKRIFMVGTDGQRRRKRPGIDFVTCIAMHDRGKGGRGFWARTRFKDRHSLQQKLMQETWQSLEVAFALMEVVPEDDQHEIEIHVDANPDNRWASSKYHKQMSGMVTGQGFRAVLKPNAWVSSHMADHYVKGKHLR
jgi:predicted RNase H-related nuclease YkuK (DUF458 family)